MEQIKQEPEEFDVTDNKFNMNLLNSSVVVKDETKESCLYEAFKLKVGVINIAFIYSICEIKEDVNKNLIF